MIEITVLYIWLGVLTGVTLRFMWTENKRRAYLITALEQSVQWMKNQEQINREVGAELEGRK